MAAPLADVRIIAVEQYGAGPWGTLQLADLGAEVIKIEDPASGGDVSRYVPPFARDEDSLFFETFNRNKKSVSLDLRSEHGRSVLEDLIRSSHAVYSNLRGDQPKKLRLTYEDLCDVNPEIVCCSLSGFGNSGPRSNEPGYDYIMQAMSGWMSLTGDPSGPPTKSGLSLVDLSGGYVSAIALLSALWAAKRDGRGCDCDISLYETALHQVSYLATWAATAGYEPQRMPDSAHPSIVPFQAFQTSDGWITVACAKQKFWEMLCAALDRNDLYEDPRYADFGARNENRDELLAILRETFEKRSNEEWIEILAEAGVPMGPVYDVETALQDPQVEARGSVVEIDHPNLGPVRQVASPLRVDIDREPLPLDRGPFRGEHTDQILRDVCGYEDQQIAELREAKTFG